MKLPEHQKKEIINGMLPVLIPFMEPGTELMEVSGNILISNGVTTDVKNNPIIGSKKYIYPVEKMLPVNHFFKISELIEKAENLEHMQTLLAEYLTKFGTQFQTKK